MDFEFIKKNLIPVYLVVFYTFWLVFFGFLKVYYIKSYSVDKLTLLTDQSSRWEQETTDICRYRINGEPSESQDSYVKILLKCKNSESNNSLSLKSVNDKNFGNVMALLAKINKFDKEIILNKGSEWKCFQNGIVITEDSIVVNNSLINCSEKI